MQCQARQGGAFHRKLGGGGGFIALRDMIFREMSSGSELFRSAWGPRKFIFCVGRSGVLVRDRPGILYGESPGRPYPHIGYGPPPPIPEKEAPDTRFVVSTYCILESYGRLHARRGAPRDPCPVKLETATLNIGKPRYPILRNLMCAKLASAKSPFGDMGRFAPHRGFL